MRLSVVRVNGQGLLITLNRSLQLTECLECKTEVIMRLSVVRVKSQGLLIMLNRRLQLTEFLEANS